MARYNPATGNFEEDEEDKGTKLAESMIERAKEKPRTTAILPSPSLTPEEERLLKPKRKKEKQVAVKEKPRGILLKRLGLRRREIKARPLRDRLKVMRLQNMLDKKRLQNQIERLKLQRKVELLRKKGMLKQVMMPVIRPRLLDYPAYATPEIMGDIDSAFFADIGHADGNIWGNEAYYDEDFYTEDFYGTEFDTDPFFHLQIKPNYRISPLLW